MVTVGNIAANFYYGSALNLVSTTSAAPATYGSGIAVPQIVVDANGRISSISTIPLGQGTQNLQQVVDTGNTTSNTILFTNVSNALVATGNVVAANFRLTSTSVQLGVGAGTVGQNTNSVSIGSSAGQSGQYIGAVAIGLQAGQLNQKNYSVALGQIAGQCAQASYAIAIGAESGVTTQNVYAVSLGYQAGFNLQNAYAIAIGSQAGNQSQGFYSVAIGTQAGGGTQGSSSVAIGNLAGYQFQSANAITIGSYAGQAGQNAFSISIGDLAGQIGQYQKTVAIGQLAGQLTQQSYGVAIGLQAGQFTQNVAAIAIGSVAGTSGQQSSAVAIGDTAGNISQGSSAVAIGNRAGQTRQGSSAVAIGDRAGQTNQGNNSIAIGNQAGSSTAGSIMLNAGGTAKNTAVAGFHVFPVRTATTNGSVLEYDATTGEIYYNNATLNNNYLYVGGSGTAIAPTSGSISNGTKLLLWNDGSGYSIGIEGGTMWFNIPNAASQYKWYYDGALRMTLSNGGNLTTTGYVSANGLYIGNDSNGAKCISSDSNFFNYTSGMILLRNTSGDAYLYAWANRTIYFQVNNDTRMYINNTETYVYSRLRTVNLRADYTLQVSPRDNPNGTLWEFYHDQNDGRALRLYYGANKFFFNTDGSFRAISYITNDVIYMVGNYISRTTGTGVYDYRIFIGTGGNNDMVLNCGATMWFRILDDTRMTINNYETYVYGILRSAYIRSDGNMYVGGTLITGSGITANGEIAASGGSAGFRVNSRNGYNDFLLYSSGGELFIYSYERSGVTHKFRHDGIAARIDSSIYWNTWSDRNLKTDIVNANLDTCYENIKNLSLKRYRFKDEVTMINKTDANRLGFIAQDVQLVFPKAVTEETSGPEGTDKFLSLNLDQLNYTLYGAVQKIIEKIENNQKRGSVVLANGFATVTIDSSTLGENPQLFLQPQMTFDRVMGEIVGDQINIICENMQSTATVNWLIVSG